MMHLLLPVLFVVSAAGATVAAPSSLPHPLDPLSADELTAVLASPLVPVRPLSFHYVGLDEPDKPDVLSYAYAHGGGASQTLPRRALVVARAGGQTHEPVVGISGHNATAVLSHAVHHGPGFPRITTEDQIAAMALPPKYGPFVASVRRRGLDVGDVACGVISRGWFGGEEEPDYGGARVAKMQCVVATANGTATANIYARPLEGVTLVVDLDTVAIVGYEDTGARPVPKAQGTDYRADNKVGPPFTGPETKPGVVVQSEGRGFHVDGRVVRWANWEFHVGFDMRAGPVISLASVYDADAGRRRRVLYRGFVSEMFVPYMDPEEEWYLHTFMDAGEYGLGTAAPSLQPGADCPDNAVYMDAYYADGDGMPVKVENATCVFEQYASDVAWRHTEAALPGQVVTGGEARRDAGGEDGGDGGQLRLHSGLGVEDGGLHQVRRLAQRHPGDEGDALHPRRPDDRRRRARHAGGGEHRRRLPRPLRHVPPGPRRRRHRQLFRQEHIRRHAQHRGPLHRRRRHAAPELLDGAARCGRDGGGRAGGRERRAARGAAGREPEPEDEAGERGRVPARPGRRDGGVAAGGRRLPAAPRQLHQEVGVGDAVRPGGEVGVGDVRRAEPQGRQLGGVEQQEQGDQGHRHRALVHRRAAPPAVPGGFPGDADGERWLRAPAVKLLREQPVDQNKAAWEWKLSELLLPRWMIAFHLLHLKIKGTIHTQVKC